MTWTWTAAVVTNHQRRSAPAGAARASICAARPAQERADLQLRLDGDRRGPQHEHCAAWSPAHCRTLGKMPAARTLELSPGRRSSILAAVAAGSKLFNTVAVRIALASARSGPVRHGKSSKSRRQVAPRTSCGCQSRSRKSMAAAALYSCKVRESRNALYFQCFHSVRRQTSV
jgi:hypothetical protein